MIAKAGRITRSSWPGMENGERCWAMTGKDPDLFNAMEKEEFIGKKGRVSPGGDFTEHHEILIGSGQKRVPPERVAFCFLNGITLTGVGNSDRCRHSSLC